MYTVKNFKTKKALKDFVLGGGKVEVYQPGGLDKVDYTTYSGNVTLEGPHYPEPHRWYARATVVDGFITKVK